MPRDYRQTPLAPDERYLTWWERLLKAPSYWAGVYSILRGSKKRPRWACALLAAAITKRVVCWQVIWEDEE